MNMFWCKKKRKDLPLLHVPFLLVWVSPHNKCLSKKGSRLKLHSVNSVEDHKWSGFISFAHNTREFLWLYLVSCLRELTLTITTGFSTFLTSADCIVHFPLAHGSERFCSPTGKVGKVEEAATNRHGYMVLIPLRLKISSIDFISYNTMCTQIIVLQTK